MRSTSDFADPELTSDYKIIIQEVEVKADVAARTDFLLRIATVSGQISRDCRNSKGFPENRPRACRDQS